jgi:hypothetical protein
MCSIYYFMFPYISVHVHTHMYIRLGITAVLLYVDQLNVNFLKISASKS